jgi:hypothetical protein
MENRDIREIMGEMAQIDSDLPMSLISDTWDILHMAGKTAPTLAEWTKALNTAIQGYWDDLYKNGKYTHNPMKFSIRTDQAI